jgi:hypothetical protein
MTSSPLTMCSTRVPNGELTARLELDRATRLAIEWNGQFAAKLGGFGPAFARSRLPLRQVVRSSPSLCPHADLSRAIDPNGVGQRNPGALGEASSLVRR